MSNKSLACPGWIALAAFFTLPPGCGFRSDSAATEPEPVISRSIQPANHKPFFQAGFAYSRIGGNHDSDVSSLELGKMRAAGANIFQFLAFAYIHRLDGPEIGMEREHSERVLRGGIKRAKAAGLRAMVKLQMWGPGFQDGKFSADIDLINAADWREFMANYRLSCSSMSWRPSASSSPSIPLIATRIF